MMLIYFFFNLMSFICVWEKYFCFHTEKLLIKKYKKWLSSSFTHDIEAVSCDEMLVDCTDLLASTGAEPEQFASLLRHQILDRTGCTASAGMGKKQKQHTL